MNGKMRWISGGWRRLWPMPWTLVGVVVGGLAVVTGGRVRIREGVLEFSGGLLQVLLRGIPIPGGASAVTLGHTVLGRTAADLDRTRRHELVHIRQYELWGALFVPAYLLASGLAWLNGNDPYRDNPFEREAYADEHADCDGGGLA